MNRTTTTSSRATDLLALSRPAALVIAIAALSSCHAAAEPEQRTPFAYNASNALPTIGNGEELPMAGATDSAQTQPTRPLPADIKERFDNSLKLDYFDKSMIGLRRSQAEKAAIEDPNVLEARRAADALLQEGLPQAVLPNASLDAALDTPLEGPAEQPIARRTRPPVMWEPVQPPPSDKPSAYAGPDAANTAESDGSASAAMNTADTSANPSGQNAAQVTPPKLRLADLITPLKSQLAMQAADSNSPLREYLVGASLLMLENQRRTDPATLHDLTDREREVLTTYQDYFTRLGEALRDGGGVDAVVKETRDIATSLGSEIQLRVPEFRLCSRIVNFGLYDEIASYKFPAMRPTPLLTYVEIEGFKSVPGGDGKYVTRVRHELELYSEADGELVYSWPSAPAEDICGKVRRDFFLPRQIQLPSNLTVGRYRLKVRITDDQSQAQAESVLAFSIVAGGEVAVSK